MRIFTNIAVVAACTFSLPALAQEATEPTWVEVNLETPGSLGVEILYQVNVLSDVTHLRVSGAMNTNDWSTIKNISGLQQLDLSKASTEAIPENQFEGRTAINTITFPPELKTIGDYAFSKSGLKEALIPTSVEYIGNYAFNNCTGLTTVEFDKGSLLSELGENVFYGCNALKAIAIPDGITRIPFQAFRDCQNLESVKLPSNLKEIRSHSFYDTKKLSLIDLPESLGYIFDYAFGESGLQGIVIPNGVYEIGQCAFRHCNNLTEVVLPGSVSNYNNLQFYDCKALTKITCRAATPPSVSGGFDGITFSTMTLCVPDFAVVNYKLHSFWMKCGTIEGGVKSDSWDLFSELTLSNGRRIEGTPGINMRAGSKLSVGGVAPMPIADMTLNTNLRDSKSFAYPQIINGSAAMTAKSVKTVVSLLANKWYFLTMPYDVAVSAITHSNSSASIAIRYYDGATRAANGKGGWTSVPADGTLKAAQGYIIQTNKEGSIAFHASGDLSATIFTPNAITTKLNLNEAEDAAHAGWNLIGNPWQSYYDMHYSMLTSPITVWNHSNNRYDAYSLIDDDVVLAPNQVFFIQATKDIQEIEFGTSGRQFTTEISRAETRSTSGSRAICNLELEMNGMTDHTRIVINEGASEGYEPQRDASKFFSENEDVPQLYTVSADGDRLAINERPQNDGAVKIGFYAPSAGEMELSFRDIPGTATLTDRANGNDIKISTGDTYTFSAEEPGFNDDRLVITLNASTSAVDVMEYSDPVAISCNGNTIRISTAKETNVTIVTIEGLTEVNDIVNGEDAEYELPAGIHIVKAGTKTVKCIIK